MPADNVANSKLDLKNELADFRIVSATQYFKPSYRPHRRGMLAALPAAIDAQHAVNGVYLGDVKQHFLSGLTIANHQNGAGVTTGVVNSGIDISRIGSFIGPKLF